MKEYKRTEFKTIEFETDDVIVTSGPMERAGDNAGYGGGSPDDGNWSPWLY